jgi:hypothetical protein
MADSAILPPSTKTETMRSVPFKPKAKPSVGKSVDFTHLAPVRHRRPGWG